MNPEILKSIENVCIVNIKSEGSFDKLRSECIGEIQKEYQFQQLRSQIEDQTINYIKGKRERSSGSQSKSEIRGGLRTYLNDALNGILKPQMDSLVDSIIKSQESYMRQIVKQTVESISNPVKEYSPPGDNCIPELGAELVVLPSVCEDAGQPIYEETITNNTNNNNNNNNNDDDDAHNIDNEEDVITAITPDSMLLYSDSNN
ncbi:hypothetical protein LOD99_3490 [Oopsacas minuta]|uniref:BOD1/SHG1 domain-containing protein n=1 Tax=Oopsacas minuta TaxID=111878 RepID=A0AAV7JXQ2_9METZ|nr:hypothetical protein LOD99_3490 [Oopsacas minuta]